MDEATRARETRQNPAALLALAWYSATGGAGKKDMVLLPYKDRLELFSRYLQQLVMESLGKRLDLAGKVVNQGIAVYGNKGSTDQHAYVQQLRDGLDNFFITFIEVLRDRAPERPVLFVDGGPAGGVTSGDYLFGFLQGTRRALTESGRESLTLTVETVDAADHRQAHRPLRARRRLLRLARRHQRLPPARRRGREEGGADGARAGGEGPRRAPAPHAGKDLDLAAVAKAAGTEDLETVFWILRHLAANPWRGLTVSVPAGKGVFDATYRLSGT